MRVTVFREGIVRVRVAPQGTFPKDFSWAVIEPPEASTVKIEESNQDVRIVTSRVVVLIEKSPILISFIDPFGNAVLADEPALPMAWDGSRIHAWKRMPADEGYYGLEIKPGR